MSRPADWEHAVKLDPDKELVAGETFTDVAETGTDALVIGGTTGITREKTARVVEACARSGLPLYVEPSHPDAVVHDEDLDGYLIPIVLNAGDVAWTTGAHKEWVKHDPDLDWAGTTTEAYVVLNSESSVAQYTQAECDLSPEDVAAYATVAEQMLGQEIVYLEYSGRFGDSDVVAAAADAIDEATLFYGGGIHDYETAYEMSRHADTVIVGDLVHDKGVDAVRETVEGAKAAGCAS